MIFQRVRSLRQRLALLPIAALMCCVGSLSAQNIVVEGGKTYKLHKVVKGEGFYRLSVDNGVSQEDILAANPELRNTGLVEGVTVRIPVKGSVQPAKRVKKEVVVKAGDTLYSLSKAYGMTISEFLDLNSQVSASGLREGVKVVVLTDAPASPSASPNVQAKHIVKKGETAFSISQAYGISVSEFYQLNPQCTGGVKEGDMLNVPARESREFVYHVIAQGETLYAIGVRYGVKANQIIEANIALNPNALVAGSAIRIPLSSIPDHDDAFYYHRIAAGETLYSLCVQYNVAQERIQTFNTGVDWNALRVGQVVAVPRVGKVETGSFEREVQKRETVFSIAQEEGITVDELLKANEGLTADNLQKGMKIRIPQFRDIKDVRPATTDAGYVGTLDDLKQWSDDYDYVAAGRPVVNVFLMLPFNSFNEMKAMRSSGVNTATQPYAFKSRRYVEFYEGVRLALDSLASGGANVNLTVFDTNNRLDVLNQLNTATVAPDLIIGPAHRDEMADIMRYAVEKKVPVVLPFAQCDSTILDNPYIFQASVIDSITGKEIYERMTNEMRDAHVIIIRPKTKGRADVNRLKSLRALCQKKSIDMVEFDYNTTVPDRFLSVLSPDKRNVVVMPTNNEANVNSVLTSLSGVVTNKENLNLQLWGTSDWLTFQTIEVEVFHKLHTHIFSTFAVDEADPDAARVLNRYRRLYFTEPIAFTPFFQRLRSGSGFSEYGLWGYDIALKFVGARVFKGPQFVRNVNGYAPRLVQSNFHFRNLTNWGGAVNVGLKTITFEPNGTVTIKSID